MIDIHNLDKDFFAEATGVTDTSKITIEDISHYVSCADIEKIFDKNIKIEGARYSEGYGEIPNIDDIDSEEGVWMGGRQYEPTYICYAYKIINFKKNTIIGYDIYCLNEICKIDEPYYESFADLKKNLNKHFHLQGDWSSEYIHHNFG